jgi:hypothetical protein
MLLQEGREEKKQLASMTTLLAVHQNNTRMVDNNLKNFFGVFMGVWPAAYNFLLHIKSNRYHACLTNHIPTSEISRNPQGLRLFNFFWEGDGSGSFGLIPATAWGGDGRRRPFRCASEPGGAQG